MSANVPMLDGWMTFEDILCLLRIKNRERKWHVWDKDRIAFLHQRIPNIGIRKRFNFCPRIENDASIAFDASNEYTPFYDRLVQSSPAF